MTPTRAAALEAVAEVGREISQQLLLAEMTAGDRQCADVEGAYDMMIERMRPAIFALSSLPAEPEPEGEMVEVRAAVIESSDGNLTVVGFKPNGKEWNLEHNSTWRNIATITARIPRPVVPEVRAEVEPET